MVDSFPIVAGAGRTMWVLFAVILVVMMLPVALVFVSARGAQAARFDIEPGGLRLRGDLYGRFIHASQLRAGEARIVDLAQHGDLQPTRRTIGTSVPGYRSGWFRLRGGGKALLYVTDQSRVVYVPTTDGYSLLLSPRDPERFIARLQSLDR